MSNLKETLASYAHETWCGWMKYLFSKCSYDEESGVAVIPEELVSRWKRQTTTLYEDLPEDEKESDREEAGKILAIIQTFQKFERIEENKRVEECDDEDEGTEFTDVDFPEALKDVSSRAGWFLLLNGKVVDPKDVLTTDSTISFRKIVSSKDDLILLGFQSGGGFRAYRYHRKSVNAGAWYPDAFEL